jgi:hypothetical protein
MSGPVPRRRGPLPFGPGSPRREAPQKRCREVGVAVFVQRRSDVVDERVSLNADGKDATGAGVDTAARPAVPGRPPVTMTRRGALLPAMH